MNDSRRRYPINNFWTEYFNRSFGEMKSPELVALNIMINIPNSKIAEC